MAKDKGKKKNEDAGFAKPSEAPAGDSWSLTDGDDPKSGQNDGKLFLFTPLRKQMQATKDYGDKEVIVADVVEINEKKPEKSTEHSEVFVWGAWVQGSLRAYVGERMVLGRLKREKDSKSGKGYVWKLEDATPEEEAMARAYLESVSPFPVSKPNADEKPAKAKRDKKAKAAPEPEPKKKSKKK